MESLVISFNNVVGLQFSADKVIQSSSDSYDEQKAKALWEGSEKIIGSKFLAK